VPFEGHRRAMSALYCEKVDGSTLGSGSDDAVYFAVWNQITLTLTIRTHFTFEHSEQVVT
jgi:hypothetical protein